MVLLVSTALLVALLAGAVFPLNGSALGARNDGNGSAILSAALDPLSPGMPRTSARSLQAEPAAGDSVHCSGNERQWVECDLDACDQQVCTDCVFGPWGDWARMGDCTGLCKRARTILTSNTPCGKPCDGALEETDSAGGACQPSLDCIVPSVDCVWENWGEWNSSDCGSLLTGQKRRARAISVDSWGRGIPCSGSSSETAPCGESPPPQDCTFEDWVPVGQCSATCGSGVQVFVRNLSLSGSRAAACNGTTSRLQACGLDPCPGGDSNCVLGAWSDWTECESNEEQRARKRGIVARPDATGLPCNDSVVFTDACPAAPTPSRDSCSLGEWGDWSACPVTCGGSANHRSRSLLPATNGGTCTFSVPPVTEEAQVCGTEVCPLLATDRPCQLSAWAAWSACSASCGQGKRQRTRAIANEATGLAPACSNQSITEVAGCWGYKCPDVDCKWGGWTQWSGCTRTCNGGQMQRSRGIEAAPRMAGDLCDPLGKSEVAPCNLQPCDTCRNGTWSDWSEWTACPACGPGQRSRHRDVALAPNDCGFPPEGIKDDVQPCSGAPCVSDVDCLVGAWGSWSDCSGSCFGAAERNRAIQRSAAGNGRPCVEAMKEVKPCNPEQGGPAPFGCEGPQTRDCVLSDWGDWSPCSETCDSGTRARNRIVAIPGSDMGATCSGSLSEAQSCNEEVCQSDCKDCAWGDWSDWGACPLCGGQRYRHRSIASLPNYCGAACAAGSARESSACDSDCGDKFCTWREWGAGSLCVGCGPTTSIRQRTLTLSPTQPPEFLARGADIHCGGAESNFSACPFKSCTEACSPVDCLMGDWSDWNAPSCVQLCQRQRSILQVGACDGLPCEGPLSNTKQCHLTCDVPTPCALGTWGPWSACAAGDAQKVRSRQITSPTNFGPMCPELNSSAAPLLETAPCPVAGTTDCQMGDWAAWSACPSDCTAWQTATRSRAITVKATGFGLPCDERSLSEGRPCKICFKNCSFSTWSAWTPCDPADPGYTGFKKRTRLARAGSPSGEACNGSVEDHSVCEPPEAICTLTQWTPWGECSATCNGQQDRYRNYTMWPPGAQCPAASSLHEVQGCGAGDSAPECRPPGCVLSEWGPWGQSSGPCGVTQRNRTRVVLSAAEQGGATCNGEALVQVDSFELAACSGPMNCLWGDWSDWGHCSHLCGGGLQKRTREIVQFPFAGGRACDALTRQEAVPCAMQSCKQQLVCEDAAWSDWGAWSSCSKTCDGGLTSRSRRIATPGNTCGRPLNGSSTEVLSCNANTSCTPSVDCAFSSWSDWSECSEQCTGMQERSRSIQVYGAGDGAFCSGPLAQKRRCLELHPTQCGPAIREEEGYECKLSEWTKWSLCPVTCGLGQQERSREVLREPCSAGTVETQPCYGVPCANECTPVDCAWSDWEPWSACSKCGGQTNRTRRLTASASCGGSPCVGVAAEISNCTRSCQGFCTWADWTDYSQCSATCGRAWRSRTRSLHVTDSYVPDSVIEPIIRADASDGLESALRGRLGATKAVQSRRLGGVCVSFACGGLFVLAVFLTTMRACPASTPGAARNSGG